MAIFININKHEKGQVEMNLFKGTKKYLFLTVLISLIVKIIWAFSFSVIPQSDFATYHTLATELSKGRVAFNDYISIFPHVIGYPALLSIFYKVFGASLVVAKLVNIAFSCSSIILIFFIAKSISNEKCGLISSMILAFWPSQTFYTSLVSTEAAYTFLVLLCCLLFIFSLKLDKGFWWNALAFILLGVLCSSTNVVRPFGPIFLIAVAIFYFLIYKSAGSLQKKILIKLVLYGILILSYSITSHLFETAISKAIGKDVAGSSSGYSLYVGVNEKHGGIWNEEDANTLGQLMKKPGYSAQQIHNELFKGALQRLKEQKSKNIALVYKKFKNTWSVDNESLWYINSALADSDSQEKFTRLKEYFISITDAYYNTALVLFCLYLLYMLKTRKISDNYMIFFILIVFGIIGVHIIAEAQYRYHYPAIPFISLAAGTFLEKSKQLFQSLFAKLVEADYNSLQK